MLFYGNISMSKIFLPRFLSPKAGLYIHTQKSVKFTCSSRFSRASQSPYTVEKQPKSTPDMYYPPRPTMGVGSFKHTLMDIHCCCGGCVQNFAKILRSREQRFNKRLSICHRFFTLSVPAVRVLRPERGTVIIRAERP